MKFAVLGTGMVGNTLGTKLVALGHEVRMGARSADNAKAQAFVEANGQNGSQGTFRDAAAWADRIVVVVSGGVLPSLAEAVGAETVAGKTVIDVSNPLDMEQGFPPPLLPEMANTTSAGELLQSLWPEAKVVKALNTMTHSLMVDPGQLPDSDAFIAGNDDGAKAEVRALLESFGWTTIHDMGDIAGARGMEGLMLFWLRMMGQQGTALFNYKIVTG